MKSKFKKINVSLNQTSTESISESDPQYTFIVFHNPASVEINDSFFDASALSVLIRKPSVSLNIKSSGNYALSFSLIRFQGSDASKIFSLSNAEANILLKPLQVHFTDTIFTKIET